MLLIFSTLQIINLDKIIMVINIIKAIILTIIIITIILTITTITIIIIVSHREKSVIFLAKKIIALINIQTMSNKK